MKFRYFIGFLVVVTMPLFMACTKEQQKPNAIIIIGMVEADAYEGINQCKTITLEVSNDSAKVVKERPYLEFRNELGTSYGVFRKECHAISGKEMNDAGSQWEVSDKDIKVAIDVDMYFSTDTAQIEKMRTEGQVTSVSNHIKETLKKHLNLKRTGLIEDGYYFSLLSQNDTNSYKTLSGKKVTGAHNVLSQEGFMVETVHTNHTPVMFTPKIGLFERSVYSNVSGAAHGFRQVFNEAVSLLSPVWQKGTRFSDTLTLYNYAPKDKAQKEAHNKAVFLAKCGCFNDVDYFKVPEFYLDSLYKVVRECANLKSGEPNALKPKIESEVLMGDPAVEKPIFSTIQLERLKGRMAACYMEAYDACYACSDGDYNAEASVPIYYFKDEELGSSNAPVTDWNALSKKYKGLKDIIQISKNYRLICYFKPVMVANEVGFQTERVGTLWQIEDLKTKKIIWQKEVGSNYQAVIAQER